MDPLEEELLAVEAIFPECISRESELPRRLAVTPSPESTSAQVTLSVPQEYPQKPPTIQGYVGLTRDQVQNVLDDAWTPGEVCLYDLLDKLRELLEEQKLNVAHATPRIQSPRRPTILSTTHPSDTESDDSDFDFAVSEPIVDRKSTFVGRAIEVHSRAEAASALLWLKQHNKKIARATHNIVAWRLVENGALMQGRQT